MATGKKAQLTVNIKIKNNCWHRNGHPNWREPARETRERRGGFLSPPVCPPRAPQFFLAYYFQAPAAQAIVFRIKWNKNGPT